MHPALIVIFITLGVLLFIWLVLSRIISKIHPTPISHRLAIILDNPVRRHVFSPAKLLDKVGIAAGMSVLELGPGPGFFTVESAQRVYSSEGLGKLYCLDIQPAMIDRVKKKIFKKALENVELTVGNGECLPYKNGSFDLAYMVTVLGEMPDKTRALQELYRVVRPDGVLSISEYLPDPDYPLRRTTVAWARRAGFEPSEEFGNFFAYVINFRRSHIEIR